MGFIGVEVQQETSVPPPKKNPGSAPAQLWLLDISSNSNLPSVLFEYVLKAFMTCCDLILNDGKRTEWSLIGSLIIQVIKQN